ncbi:methyltransferase domain-containing protein [Streptomyces sp. NBC_01381]|uniref:class I SAM-dependent methyltransferase n=1 Tax=Streptomyces sp. NBC_01381 TaxID=2903845 RepID=UPI002253F655|nr:class I SAM-dependent methyltransferase [Streptomyces sp. NBC_01381]MCX4671035.1 methyltransferase domain-containing protein [Streptomyces sp. NBC_01381]
MTAPVVAAERRALTPYEDAPDPGPLLALNFGFARARVLGTALDLGVFTGLARGPRGTRGLAAELGCDTAALRALLAALEELALVTGGDDESWALTEVSRAYLVRGRRGYLGDHFADVLAEWEQWSGLTELVRRGGHGGGELGAPEARGRYPGMFCGIFPVAVRTAFRVVRELALPAAGRVLDFAAGSGEWGIALAAADPEARVVAHDDPELLGAARGRAEEFGVAERFRFVPADFTGDAEKGAIRAPFPDGCFDTVVLAHLSRFAGPAATERLVAECARLLCPGGTLLVVDVMRQEPGRPALHRPMIALSLLVNTEAGAVQEESAYRAVMEKYGVTAKESVTPGLITVLTGERR